MRRHAARESETKEKINHDLLTIACVYSN